MRSRAVVLAEDIVAVATSSVRRSSRRDPRIGIGASPLPARKRLGLHGNRIAYSCFATICFVGAGMPSVYGQMKEKEIKDRCGSYVNTVPCGSIIF